MSFLSFGRCDAPCYLQLSYTDNHFVQSCKCKQLEAQFFTTLSFACERSLNAEYRRAHCGSMFRPFTRFCPWLFTVSRKTSGLVRAKLVGDRASMYWRV